MVWFVYRNLVDERHAKTHCNDTRRATATLAAKKKKQRARRADDGTIETRSFETKAERSAWAERFTKGGVHYAVTPDIAPPMTQQISPAPTASGRKAARRAAWQARRISTAPFMMALLVLLGAAKLVGWPVELLLGTVWALWMWA
jgi:hypothetical protein